MIRNIIKNTSPKIVAKIENQKGINSLDEIITKTTGFAAANEVQVEWVQS